MKRISFVSTACKLPWPKITPWKGESVVIYQQKFDGYGVRLVKDADGQMAILSHRPSSPQNYSAALHSPKVKAFCNWLPNNTVAWGELWAVDTPASKVVTRLKENSGQLQLSLFTILVWGDEVIHFVDSAIALLKYNRLACAAGFEATAIASPKSFAKDFKGQSTEQVIKSLHAQARSQHIEGYVLKADATNKWYKVKPVQTLDTFVISIEYSKIGNRKGLVRAFEIGVLKDNEVFSLGYVGSGFTKLELESFVGQEQRLLNRVMEVEFDSIMPSKQALRFPRFIRWRSDKQFMDCNYEQLD